MKTILWVQNEDALIPDTFIIDGCVSHYSNTPEQNEAFSALTKASSEVRISPKARRIFSEQKGFTEQANFGIKDETYYIQGCFNELDNSGRNMPYMFLIKDCRSYEQAVERLKEYASILNRTCIQADLQLMSNLIGLDSRSIDRAATKMKYKILKKKDKTLLSVIGILIVILLVWLIWN